LDASSSREATLAGCCLQAYGTARVASAQAERQCRVAWKAIARAIRRPCNPRVVSLLREIQNAAASDEIPVATLLRKARILAVRLNHEPLQRWVTSELESYGPEDELPDYRRLRHLDVKADFSGPFGSGLRKRMSRSPWNFVVAVR
jgi:hypothetical protein